MHAHILTYSFLIIAGLSFPVTAEELVYTWTDENGITHFSDAPPTRTAAASGEVETMAMPTGFPETTGPAEDYYSVINQWQRMQEERAAREELALEQRRVRIQETRAERATSVAANDNGSDRHAVVLGGGLHHPHTSGFVRSGFSGHHGKKAGLSHKGHHHKHKRAHHHDVRQPQHFLGNHGRTASRSRNGLSARISYKVGPGR